MSVKIETRTDSISADDFLIERPFGQDGELLFEQWFNAAQLFLGTAHQFGTAGDFIAEVNATLSVLETHSPNLDKHLFQAKPGFYGSSRKIGTNVGNNRDKTRAFLLLEEMFSGFGPTYAPLFGKTDTAIRQIRVPSPLLFLRRLLTSDEFMASESYAHAVIRAEIFASTVRSFPPDMEMNASEYVNGLINFDSVSKALGTIDSYEKNRDSTYLGTPTLFIVANYLASLGLAKICLSQDTVEKRPRRKEYRLLSVQKFLDDKTIDILQSDAKEIWDNFGYEIKLTCEANALPSIPQILNDLEGIPFPIPGAKTVFAGGIRMTDSGGAVVRISGKSGTGKTSLALATCVGLAPLGTQTFYLSCEEEREDLVDRISSVTPEFISQTRGYTKPSADATDEGSWFQSIHLASTNTQENFDNAKAFVDQIIEEYTEEGLKMQTPRPPGVLPYVVVLDGVHELIDRNDSNESEAIGRIHDLVETYRKLNVLVILVSAAVDTMAFKSLDYLVDVVIDLDSDDLDYGSHKPLRKLNLSKTRRQFSNTGSHRYHISKRDGVRFYPNLEAVLEQFKAREWQRPDERLVFDFFGSRSMTGTHENWLKVFSKSHTLITGKGSSGKAGFALRLLTSPIVPKEMKTGKLKGLAAENSGAGRQRRILILSFLYPSSYYDVLLSKIEEHRFTDRTTDVPPPPISCDVLTFYPGYISPEVFLTKITDMLRSAELQGASYEGVLVDGLHNVFLQFPILERSPLIWPMLSELFRRLGVNVVTTHAHFDVIGMEDDPHLAMDVRSVAHRSTPLLQALVNSADYYIDVSAEDDGENADIDHNLYKIRVATALGQAVPRDTNRFWHREAMQIVGKRPN